MYSQFMTHDQKNMKRKIYMLCWPKHVSYLIRPVGMIYCEKNVLLQRTIGHVIQESRRTLHLLPAAQVCYKIIVVLHSILSLRPSWQWLVVQQHTHRMHSCVRFATMVTLTCRNITLYIHRVRKSLYPFFIFFLGAQCVESGVSCTDCY